MGNTVEIKKVVYGGLGLAHDEGDTIFIPYTAPGDKVSYRTVSRKKKCVFAEIEAVETPSPLRREPECPVFAECGGCQMLHLDYDEELKLKKEAVAESLERIGKIRMDTGEVIPSPSRFGYRNHSMLQVDGDGRPGFNRRESSEVVPFPEAGCLLLPEKMREAIGGAEQGSFPAGSEVRVRMDSYGNIHFWGMQGYISPPDILMRAGGFNFPVQPASFFQVNSLLNDTLLESVMSLPSSISRKLADLYCGCGFFTLPMTRLVKEAVGIERDPGAVRSANAAKRLNGVSNVYFRRGSVEREMGRVRDADLVLADPPRSGIPRAVMSAITKSRPSEMIMVSCEPPAFARDAKRMIEAGYMLSKIILIDMFPGTYHVETVGFFRRS